MQLKNSGTMRFKIKNPRVRRLLAFMLALSMAFSFLPMGSLKVMAVQAGDFDIVELTSGASWTYGSNTLTIIANGNYRIGMSTPGAITTTDRIVVVPGVAATITLDNVRIDVSSSPGDIAFDAGGATTVGLILVGNNELIGGSSGLDASNAELYIRSISGSTPGALKAVGGGSSPGIGFTGGAGRIDIYGNAVVTATGGAGGGAGIGGGSTVSGGNIYIYGNAVVTAEGGAGGGAGIGGGYRGAGGNITIADSARVEAVGDGGGAGIGGGFQGASGNISIITITGTPLVDARGGFTFGHDGAGIGSGGDAATGGTITISIIDGVITAAAGSNASSSAAIGKGSGSGGPDTVSFTMPNYEYFHNNINSALGAIHVTDTTLSPLTFPPFSDYKYLRILRGGAVTLSPSSYTFPPAAVGYPTPAGQVFTITNNTAGPVTITGVAPGANFAFSAPLLAIPYTLGPGASVTLGIRPNTGLAAGTHTGTLTVTGSDSGGTPFTLTSDLTFEVEDPPLAFGLSISPPDPSPGPFSFPPAEAGYGDQALQEFTIRNIGTANITGLTATLGKGALSEFTIGQVLSVSALSPGAEGTIRLRPVTGLAAGTYTDTLTITGDGGVTRTINLSFTVTQGFVPVTGISGVPYIAEAGTPLTLTGTVNPEGAANMTIVWSVLDPGATGAVITNNVLTASSPGVVTIRATIANGLGPGMDYTQDFMVLVTPEGYTGGDYPGYPGWFFPGFPWGGYSGAYINPQLVYYEKGSSRDVSVVLYRSGYIPANLRYEGRYEDFTGGWGWGGNYAGGYGGPYGGPYDGRYARPYDGLYDGRYAGPYDGLYDGRYDRPYDAPYDGRYDRPYDAPYDGRYGYEGGYSSGSYAGGSPNRGYILAEGRDYTAIRDVFTLKASFLDTLPAGGHVISFVMNGGVYPALFIAVTDPGGGAVSFNPFIDIREGDWFFDAVLDLYRRQVMIGVSDNRFGWDEELTRAMMVTILYRLAGEPDIGGVPNPFYDVPEGTWYTVGVKWAAENQITEGYGGGRFAPADPITNEQLAVFISRVQESDVNKPPFILEVREWQDSENISSWARTAVHTLSAQGIYRDIPGRNLSPGDPAPRAVVASMLYRYLTAIGR